MQFYKKNKWSLKRKLFLLLITLLFVLYYFSLPKNLFDFPYSTAVFDSDSILIGAHVATDGQWRFKSQEKVPIKYEKALLSFEDKRFYYHPGIDILSLLRAVKQNIKYRKFVSGASTISMQVIRLSKKNPKRNLWNKLIEIILATRLELRYSKSEILKFYASNAPFGGNVVGLEAASWRYFGKSAKYLSWAQSATLAVLPNSPGLIHPGANRPVLLHKRNLLLKKMNDQGIIDDMIYQLAIKEEIPPKPIILPQIARHLVDRLSIDKKGGMYFTFINSNLQNEVNGLVRFYQNKMLGNEIYNIAVIVLRNEDGAVLSYVGNTSEARMLKDNYVDMIMSGRSGGSILKPLLYASAIEEGTITPYQLLSDVPIFINGYSPENYNRSFDGAVTVSDALRRSLNIPAVLLLRKYGISKMINRLKDFGFTTINNSADYYGLPLILGGPDVKLWELSGVFSSMSRTLNNYIEKDNRYFCDDFHPPVLLKSNYNQINNPKEEKYLMDAPILSASAIWNTFNIMTKVERPNDDGKWEEFSSSRKIAWKTGTSFGFKDAWSVGVSKDYTVGIWVGNCNGQGRPELVGVKAAAPILFDVFGKMPYSSWFEEPLDDTKEVILCRNSGYIISNNCETADTVFVPSTAVYSEVCPYHKIILTDKSGEFLIPDRCRNELEHKIESRFVLPPLQEYYFKMKHPQYLGMPTKTLGCDNLRTPITNQMEFIYPNFRTKVIIPKEFDGQQGKVVFKLAHRNPKSRVFWHIDNQFIKTTSEFHNIEIYLPPGQHVLTVVDEMGNKLSRDFEVVK